MTIRMLVTPPPEHRWVNAAGLGREPANRPRGMTVAAILYVWLEQTSDLAQ